MKALSRACLSILLFALPVLALAAGTNGTYATRDGYYRINVVFAPGKLTVTEPNKVSPYTATSTPNVYYFRNPTNNIEYLMEVVNDRTLLAYKPGGRANNTQLDLVQAAASQPSTTPAKAPVQTAEFRNSMAAAEKYKKLSQEDRVKAQIWTACAAAGLARAQKSTQESETYARETASMLKSIMLYPEASPCLDVIPKKTWDAVK